MNSEDIIKYIIKNEHQSNILVLISKQIMKN